jgi:hypothetical protein
MERKKASDFPQGLLDLFETNTCMLASAGATFIDGAQKYAVGGIIPRRRFSRS